ncbi:MAG: hypothetical protein WC517_00490 [Patescibacteria group bacterium]
MLRQSREKMDWKKREQRIIIFVALIVIPLLAAIYCWLIASYEAHRAGMAEYSRQIIESQGEHRREITDSRLEYLSGLRGPDGLYHEVNNF